MFQCLLLCDFEDKTQHSPTKSEFAQAMIDLEKKVAQDPANAARYFLKLGNGYYNMTHFGNSWMVIDYYRSDIYKTDSTEFCDCSKAKEYYMKALQSSANKEFPTKCCFMISKCDQNDFYLTGKSCEDPVSDKYRTYFKTLKEKYADTQYYKEAINECGYLNYYVKRH